MRAARPGNGHFLRGRAYRNKELCCLLQWLASRAAARADWEGGVDRCGQADGQAGRHTSGGESGQ